MGGEIVDIIATVGLKSIKTPDRDTTETKTHTTIIVTIEEMLELITHMRQKGKIMTAMVVGDVAHTITGIIFFTTVMTRGGPIKNHSSFCLYFNPSQEHFNFVVWFIDSELIICLDSSRSCRFVAFKLFSKGM